MIFQQLDKFLDSLRWLLSEYQPVDEGHRYPWENHVWVSKRFRRAHLDIVDVRDTRKLVMAHLTITPHFTDPSPIFGFDLIAGPKKVTGAFHDFSPIGGDTHLDLWFKEQSAKYQPTKERALPDWAKAIFSDGMIAASNIQEQEEFQKCLRLALNNLQYYLDHVGTQTQTSYKEQQNNYCRNQKRNPHTPRVMESLGYEPEVIREFIDTCLFPEV